MEVAGDTLTLSRAVPVRFDLSVETRFDGPHLRRGRLAHQVRQDMWRRLKRLRGFRPAVAVTREDGGLRVRAGGAVAGRVPARAMRDLADMLDDQALRARWVAFARRRP